MRNSALPAAAALLVASACTDDGRAPAPGPAPTQAAHEVEQPAGWNDELALVLPRDRDPDPDVVEIDLEARIEELEIVPGTRTPAWTYNGSLPGPLIRAKVGDRIIVHFKNWLPEATSIHWHGLRVPNEMDGVPGLTQPPIEPGAEFRYEFVARDAGTYWYHPHLNSAAQVGWGLYGPLVVEDPADPKVFGDELVLVLSDMSLDEAGQFLPADHGGEFGDLFGREGQVLLVNGKVRPHLKVRSGKQQRWRVVNAARARYFSVQLRGHTLVRLGGDNGLAERSRAVNRVVVVPGERADLVFTPADAPGTARTFVWIPTERGFGSVYNRPREDLMYIDTVADPAVTPEQVPEVLRPIDRIDVTNAKEIAFDLTIDSETMRDGTKVVMGIDGTPYWKSKPLEARIGETQIWTIRNDTAFSHPFHLHGYFFQVLDDTRIPEWKDTVDIPSRSTLRIAVRFDDRPGVWMYHCHILDHAESGMMGHLWVAPEGEHGHPPHVELTH